MRRASLIGLALPLVLLVGKAFAQAVGSAAPTPTGPSFDYLLSLGPYGALVWGAYMLGRGVKFTIQIELSEQDRDLLTRLAEKRPS